MENTKQTKAVPKFGAKDKFGYMMGDFGCNMSFQLITTYLMFFFTEALHMDPFLFTVLIIIAKIFDAINDPIIGAIVDRRRPGKGGKYKPWIFWGAFAILASTTLLFMPIDSFPVWGKFTYVLVMYMVWSVSYTAANVPYGSLNAALTDKQNERASLSALRNIGAGLAMLPVLVLVPILTENNNNMFVVIAFACGVIGLFGFLCTIFLCKERRVTVTNDPNAPKANYFKTLKAFFKNRSVVALSLASIAQIVFIQSYAALFPYVFKYYFGATKLAGVANVLAMAGMMIFIPFMGKLSGKFGKKEICTWPNLFGAAGLVIMLIMSLSGAFPRNETGAIIYTAMYMITMIGAGTFFLATWGMVADCVDEQEIESGQRDEASIYATYSLSRKIAQGIGGGLIGLCIGMVGFNPDLSLEENSAIEIAQPILNISLILPLIGFVIIFATLFFMYTLDRKKVESNTIALREKLAQAGIDSETPTRCFYDESTEVEVAKEALDDNNQASDAKPNLKE